ncbi:MAG: YhcH/YjgK/YiaL family protein [Candidatus Hodarchaeota archaeon]
MIHDKLENWTRYKEIKADFADAFKWIEEHKDNPPKDGKYPVKEGMFAIVDTYKTKSLQDSEFEAHRKYMDIQYVISGKEFILNPSTVDFSENHVPYSEDKDIEFFKVKDPKSDSSRMLMHKGDFLVLWPGEWHMPCVRHIESKADDVVKKIVIKIEMK